MAHDTTYLAQWLKTSTEGLVTYEIAFATNRLKFICKKCYLSLVIDDDAIIQPTISQTVDYRIQDFISQHSVSAHKASDAAKKAQQQVNAAHDYAHATASGVGAMVNAGFLAGGAASNYNPHAPAPMIDLKPGRAAAIKKQMDEYAQKLGDDEKQAKKIKELQTLLAPGKLIEADSTVLAWMNDWLGKPGKYPLPVQSKPKPNSKSTLSASDIQTLDDPSSPPPASPSVQKPRILKDVEGRKFR